MLSTGRTLVGGIVAGIILFVTGFIFWATPLGQIAYKTAPDAQGADLQLALNRNLTQTGTGAYIIPNMTTPQGGAAYSRGPIATVHYNTAGYSPNDMSMILPGFIIAVVSGILLALGLAVLSGTRRYGERARLVIFVSVGITLWTILAQPVFNHFGWGYWVYSFIAETTGLILAGLVVTRWFLPSPAYRRDDEALPAETRADA
ncbi:MAG TPA: hypothetical protein VF693_03330 [Allosphingosinicella sp.]|jgi:hypothetical protein